MTFIGRALTTTTGWSHIYHSVDILILKTQNDNKNKA